jgi:large subunit ribosomal protein L15
MALKVHHLRPAPGAKTAKTRVGRGEGSKGKTAGPALASLFPEGGEVTVADLVAKGAVRDGYLVKVLGNGELSVALQVSADKFSATAKEKIEKAGGSATEL